MNFTIEQARTQSRTAMELLPDFPSFAGGIVDAVFLTADRSRAFGFAGGLPWKAPVCMHLLNDPEAGRFLRTIPGSFLLAMDEGRVSWEHGEGENSRIRTEGGKISLHTAEGKKDIPAEAEQAIRRVYGRILASPGEMNEKGELVLDLKAYPVGPHYPVNLLLGNREGYPMPLVTTPKSALDAFGRGSFRGVGAQQVLATRYVLNLEENGEPANRQFYLVEDGRQIFYSADVSANVSEAKCIHSQSRTTICYETECGLKIRRTIFILPQEDGMPGAVEAQRVEIENCSGRDRRVQIIFTGMFGITDASTMANDIVYANVVVESEVWYRGSAPAALTVHPKQKEQQNEKRFVLLLSEGELMDGFCTSLSDFVGTGSLARPELAAQLPNQYSRKNSPFFAMSRELNIKAGEKKTADTFTGMMTSEGPVAAHFDAALALLLEKYADPAALGATLKKVEAFWDHYPTYIQPKTEHARFNAYVGHDLPFQTLYQTYVSRAFAWTQKAYREIGFREIQDIYASMYYLNASGKNDLIKSLLSNWIRNVYRMGYANHNFTFAGKEPGVCSDDSLWLLQALDRYTALTGDYGILLEEFEVADRPAAGAEECVAADGRRASTDLSGKRTLAETLYHILLYSGKISTGKNHLPLLDHSDWNDTLRLDPQVWNGPGKEAACARQMQETGQAYGAWLVNTQSESVMNACLLKIAADAAVRMAEGCLELTEQEGWNSEPVALTDLVSVVPEGGREPALAACERTGTAGDLLGSLKSLAEEVSAVQAESLQKNAWKGDFFARCLINDNREGGYTYLGAGGDGLALEEGEVPQASGTGLASHGGTYFLNSYSWTILADVATEEQIAVMLDAVDKHLKTDAGLKLCTIVDFDRLKINAGTALYFPGDRENGGVFKHAAMMAAVASLKAAKKVKDEALAARLSELAYFMIGRTLPYRAMENPFVLKGNPRFCTQYNNSETGENIGPMLSGTASWLSLAVYEAFGIHTGKDELTFAPLLEPGQTSLHYAVRLEDTVIDVLVKARAGKIRADENTVYVFDGEACGAVVKRPKDGREHTMVIEL